MKTFLSVFIYYRLQILHIVIRLGLHLYLGWHMLIDLHFYEPAVVENWLNFF